MIMENQSISTNEDPRVNIKVNGNLNLKGTDELHVVAKTQSKDNLTLEEATENEVSINCKSDCHVRVPRNASLHCKQIDGNTSVKGVYGESLIDKINGNLDMRATGTTTIGKVNGNLTTKNIQGDLIVGTVNGNFTARDVNGSVTVNKTVDGNLILNDVDGEISASAGGRVTLRLDPTPGKKYRLEADGNITCRLPEDASVSINISKASKIKFSLPGVEESPLSPEAPYSLVIGDGDSTMDLKAGGSVSLTGTGPDWDVMGDIDFDVGDEFDDYAEAITMQVNEQLEAQMQLMEQQLEAQMANLEINLKAAKLTEEDTRRIEEQTRRASERAAHQAEEKMRRAQVKLERKIAATQRKAERKARAAARRAERRKHAKQAKSYTWTTPPHPPTPPPPPDIDPVSEEERLMILRMLEQKKINPEEAEQLLAAIEGNGG
jgi:hypothetical protein